jgi:hypothetical protein
MKRAATKSVTASRRSAHSSEGHSGNPKGRPRRSKSMSTLVREALFELVEVRENGRRRKISKLSVALSYSIAPRVATFVPSNKCSRFPEYKKN